MILLFALVLLGGGVALLAPLINLAWSKSEFAVKKHLKRCSYPGCWKRGSECYLPDNYDWDRPSEYMCDDHKGLFYCLSCGQFWAGIESFDFIHPGYCDNCWDEIRYDYDDDYDDVRDYDDEVYDDWGFDPTFQADI
jgi:hypothetical protein